jgi:hypothetical protein
METSLAETFYAVPRILCKKRYKTIFNEQKLSKVEMESKDKALMENILHVFYLIFSHTVLSA